MDGYVIGDGKFKIGEKIADGSTSKIYKGVDLNTWEKVAIKVEPIGPGNSRLANEYKIYQHLHKKDKVEDEDKDVSVGIPSCKWYGEDSKFRFLVIELLGSNLEDHLKDFLKDRGDEAHFSLKTVLMIADQMIDTISYMHEKCVIHRDIKPEHLLMGVGSNVNKVYLIDFGLAKFYSDPISKAHIPYREGLDIVSTYRYASLYTHFGMEQSRRDDAVSFCFVIMYLLYGCLPWQGLIEGDNKDEYSLDLCNFKYKYTGSEELARMYPKEFAECLRYACVEFYARPFFLSMKSTLRQLFIREGCKYDFVYDWTKAQVEEDGTKKETLSEKPKRTLDTQDSSSYDVSNDPDKRQRIN